jgi:Ca-activated chloride channel family protein
MTMFHGIRFATPWAFLLLLAVPAVLLYLWRFGRRGTVRFSTVESAKRVGGSFRTTLTAVPLALRVLALVLVVVALARPQQGHEKVKDVTKGIAIEMVLDRSGSMGTEMDFLGMRSDRLGAVKKVFSEFIMGNGKTLKGRPNDLVGMVAFARYADTMAPLTLEHGALMRFLESIKVVTRQNEDGTSIGDAIALAAARLRTAEEELSRHAQETGGKEYEIKSKIMILLTDGQNNYGRRSPQDAAQLAAGWGIKIYAIGVGGREAVRTVRTLFGDFKVPVGEGVDEETLRQVAEATGGKFYMAEDEKSLRQIYEDIDRMETSEIESVRFVDYKELFAGFALAALCLLCVEAALSNTILRRIP